MHTTSVQYFIFHGVELIMDAIFLTLTQKILQMQNVICCKIYFFVFLYFVHNILYMYMQILKSKY